MEGKKKKKNPDQAQTSQFLHTKPHYLVADKMWENIRNEIYIIQNRKYKNKWDAKIFKNNTLLFFKIQNNKKVPPPPKKKNHPNQVKKSQVRIYQNQHHKDPSTTFVTPF